MQRARPETPFRQPCAVSTDEMKLLKMRSSVAEHRPHKAGRTVQVQSHLPVSGV